MINSVSQSPSFGQGTVYLYVKANGKQALNAVKKAFNNSEIYKATPIENGRTPILRGFSKIKLICENGWEKAERDILWDKLIGRKVVEDNGVKKVVNEGLETLVSMA